MRTSSALPNLLLRKKEIFLLIDPPSFGHRPRMKRRCKNSLFLTGQRIRTSYTGGNMQEKEEEAAVENISAFRRRPPVTHRMP